MKFADLTLPEAQAASEEARRAMLAGAQPSYTSEKRYLRKDGEVVWINLVTAPERTAHGELEYFISVFEDITKRKQMEDALRESDQKFRQLADSIDDVFWIGSRDFHQLHYLSPAFETIWGRPVESLYANPLQWVDFILPEDRGRALAAFATLMDGAPSFDIEYRIVRPGGEIRWVRVRGFQVRDAEDQLFRFSGIVTDITAPEAGGRGVVPVSGNPARNSGSHSAAGILEGSGSCLHRLQSGFRPGYGIQRSQ